MRWSDKHRLVVVRMSTRPRRVLITGLSTYWGGRLAQALEQDPEIETIIGIDKRPPKFTLSSARSSCRSLMRTR